MKGEKYSDKRDIIMALTAETEAADDSGMAIAGPVLHTDASERYLYTDDLHVGAIGETGCGKSCSFVIPTVISSILAGESFMVVGTKNEIPAYTAELAKEKGYRVIMIDPRHPFSSNRVNLLEAIKEDYDDPRLRHKAQEAVGTLSSMIFPIQGNDNDPWQRYAQSMMNACVFTLFDYARPEDISLSSVYQLIHLGENREEPPAGFGDTDLKLEKKRQGMFYKPPKLIDSLYNVIPKNSVEAMLLCSYVCTAPDTAGGMRSTFMQGMAPFFQNDGARVMFSGDDVHINHIDPDEKTAIYIIIPEETPIYDAPMAVIAEQIMSHYFRASERYPRERLARRFNCIFEELAVVGKNLPDLPRWISVTRSRGIRIMYVLQNISQLRSIFSEADCETILANTHVTMLFSSEDEVTLRKYSFLCGKKVTEVAGESRSDALITESQLAGLSTGQALIRIGGRIKYIEQLKPFYELYGDLDLKPVKQYSADDYVAVDTNPLDMMDLIVRIDIDNKVKGQKDKPVKGSYSPFLSEFEDMEDIPSDEVSLEEFDRLAREIGLPFDDPKVLTKREKDPSVRRNTAASRPYRATVVSAGKNEAHVWKIIDRFDDNGEGGASLDRKMLPVSRTFPSQKAAKRFCSEIRAAGGVAFFNEIGAIPTDD